MLNFMTARNRCDLFSGFPWWSIRKPWCAVSSPVAIAVPGQDPVVGVVAGAAMGAVMGAVCNFPRVLAGRGAAPGQQDLQEGVVVDLREDRREVGLREDRREVGLREDRREVVEDLFREEEVVLEEFIDLPGSGRCHFLCRL